MFFLATEELKMSILCVFSPMGKAIFPPKTPITGKHIS